MTTPTPRCCHTADLIGTLADRHGIERDDAVKVKRSVARRAPKGATYDDWTTECAMLLLVAALDHAHDCLNEDCERCEAIGRRLEEPDLWRAREAAHELERLLEIEAAAREFVASLDSRGVDRGRRASVAANRLRASLIGPEQDRSIGPPEEIMAESRYTKSERRRIARRAVDKTRRQIEEMAVEYNVAPTTIYNWRKELIDAGLADIPEDQLEVIEPDGVEPRIDGSMSARTEMQKLKARVRELEGALADLTLELLAARRHHARAA